MIFKQEIQQCLFKNKDIKMNNQVIRTREQKSHSIVKHALLGVFVLWIPTIYYAVSKDHYFTF